MIAFDTDIFTLIVAGEASLGVRAAIFPPNDQFLPIVVVEEVLRGRLNVIRLAEAGKSKVSVSRAYALFEGTVTALRRVRLLPYTDDAHSLFEIWRRAKLHVATHDLRIAAICVAHDVTLVSRNKRDFEQVPGLKLAIW
ncbi:MAG: type II toxin-antitoxin system VapC family toxin [Phycisphaeraceae bacterium]